MRHANKGRFPMATIDSATAALRRARKRLHHATRQLGQATTDRARARHERRITMARLRIAEEQRQCESFWWLAT